MSGLGGLLAGTDLLGGGEGGGAGEREKESLPCATVIIKDDRQWVSPSYDAMTRRDLTHYEWTLDTGQRHDALAIFGKDMKT